MNDSLDTLLWHKQYGTQNKTNRIKTISLEKNYQVNFKVYRMNGSVRLVNDKIFELIYLLNLLFLKEKQKPEIARTYTR